MILLILDYILFSFRVLKIKWYASARLRSSNVLIVEISNVWVYSGVPFLARRFERRFPKTTVYSGVPFLARRFERRFLKMKIYSGVPV